MDWYDRVKRFLGFAPNERSSSSEERHWPPRNPPQETDPPFFDRNSHQSFNVFTDPLEIHKYFEQQMSEMLRNFGFSEHGNIFGGFPQLEESPPETEGDLRDQFLKPGYEKAMIEGPAEKRDKDLDGSRLDVKDWDSVFKGESRLQNVMPQARFFGQSVSSKTVTNADGTIETHRTVKDSKGNEETTITRRLGDKEYSVTKKRNQSGQEEVIENLYNLDENEVEKYFPKQLEDPSRSSFYDRFFK